MVSIYSVSCFVQYDVSLLSVIIYELGSRVVRAFAPCQTKYFQIGSCKASLSSARYIKRSSTKKLVDPLPE